MNKQLTFIQTPIQGLQRIDRTPYSDERGYLSKVFCVDIFNSNSLDNSISQINHTYTSRKGSIRGLHFQRPPKTETKIITCIKGSVFDVAVDLRQSSPTFLHWYGEILSEENHSSLYIPTGFAHGFQTLTDNVELIYLHTSTYAPELEDGVHALDDTLKIDWPLELTVMSSRDSGLPTLDSSFSGINVA